MKEDLNVYEEMGQPRPLRETSIYLLLEDGPALARARLARYDRDDSSLTEGMGGNGVGILLHGLVSALSSPLRFSLRGSGAGIQTPSRQWDEVVFWQEACISATFCWYLLLVARTQSFCKVLVPRLLSQPEVAAVL